MNSTKREETMIRLEVRGKISGEKIVSREMKQEGEEREGRNQCESRCF